MGCIRMTGNGSGETMGTILDEQVEEMMQKQARNWELNWPIVTLPMTSETNEWSIGVLAALMACREVKNARTAMAR